MKKFGMYVYCSRRGVSRDSGLHCIIEAESLEKAKQDKTINIELSRLQQYYDEVLYEIIEIDSESLK